MTVTQATLADRVLLWRLDVIRGSLDPGAFAGGIVSQMLVSVLGIVLLVGIAWTTTLYRGLPTLFGSETRVIRIGKDVP